MARLFFLMLFVLGMATGASAQNARWDTMQAQVVEQLKSQGYADIEVSRTWLGRMYIEAKNGSHERQIVINPLTGELLRDYWRAESSEEEGNPFAHFERKKKKRSKGTSQDRDRDDDHDDDDHDDDDDEDDD